MIRNFFSSTFKKVLSSVVSVSLVLTSTLPSLAHAQSFPCNAWAADAGTDARCAAVRISGVPVVYPKLQWQRVSDMPTVSTPGSSSVQGGSEAVALANRTALALGVSASDVANASTLFPANVPYVFARYNPVDATLRIDVFKLEKGQAADGGKAGLYHAVFSPAHGDHWKANRSYIHPDAFKTGLSAGVNPFQSFLEPGSDSFKNISMPAAQVAVGHAMRLAGAPLGLVSVADTRLSQRTKKSSSLFKKKIETWVYAHAKSKWFIAQPTDVLSRSTSNTYTSFCAPDPQREDCQRFETAVSGVSFEEFEGGTLSAAEDQWEIDYQKQSGLSFLGALVLGVLGSFALAGILASAGITGLTAGAGATAGASSGATMGTFGSFLVNQGLVTGFSSLTTALAVEAAYIGLSMAIIGGANLGSVISSNPAVLLGRVKVSKGIYLPAALDKYNQRLNNLVKPRSLGEFHAAPPGSDKVLSSFSRTVMGDCGPDSKLTTCAGANGMIPRVDQFMEQNRVEFVRDTAGSLVRDATPKLPGPGN